MIKKLNDDGTFTELTDEQAWAHMLAENIALYGEEEGRREAELEWELLKTPITPWSELTEGERSLAKRMQAEHEMSVTLARGGYKSILDLPGGYGHLPDPLAPSDDDDEEVEIDLRGAREYDSEAASVLAARKARERARGGKAGS